MKCPSCGFNTFDHLEKCKKCGAFFRQVTKESTDTGKPLQNTLVNSSNITNIETSTRKPSEQIITNQNLGQEISLDELADISFQMENYYKNLNKSEQIEGWLNLKNPISDEKLFPSIKNLPEINIIDDEYKSGELSAKEKTYIDDRTLAIEPKAVFTDPDETIFNSEGSAFMANPFDDNTDGKQEKQNIHEVDAEPAINENEEVFYIASFGSRLTAMIIDLVIISSISIISLIFGLSLIDQELNIYDSKTIILFAPALLGLLLISSSYFILLHGFSGKSIGKIILGLKIINREGKTIGYWDAFVRWIGYFLSLGFIFIGFLWALIDKDSQTWHDKLAKTYVVKD